MVLLRNSKTKKPKGKELPIVLYIFVSYCILYVQDKCVNMSLQQRAEFNLTPYTHTHTDTHQEIITELYMRTTSFKNNFRNQQFSPLDPILCEVLILEVVVSIKSRGCLNFKDNIHINTFNRVLIIQDSIQRYLSISTYKVHYT